MKHPVSLLAACTAVCLAACREPVSPAPLAMAAGAAPPPEEKARPPKAAERRGRLSAIPLEVLFAKQQSGEVLIYDVRPAFIAAFGKIPGAISWPKSEFAKQLPAREPEIRRAATAGKVVVLYCTDAACPDARAVAEKLAARGHDVSVLEGGYAAWKDAGMETE